MKEVINDTTKFRLLVKQASWRRRRMVVSLEPMISFWMSVVFGMTTVFSRIR